MEIEPLGNRILVKRTKVELIEKTKGGLYLPDEAKKTKKSEFGEVLKIGPDVTKIKVGETVLFTLYTGTDINEEDDETKKGLVIMSEDDPIALIKV